MNRIQTACFALLASAFLLAGILIVRVDQKAAQNAALADQVISQPSFTMMTSRTRGEGDQSEESLFILDNNSGALLVYTPNVGRKQLQWVRTIKMSELFGS